MKKHHFICILVAVGMFAGKSLHAQLIVKKSGGTELMTVTETGKVGIGTIDPTAELDIVGQIRIRQGSPGDGKVLTSDANGLATWQLPATYSIKSFVADQSHRGSPYTLTDNNMNNENGTIVDLGPSVTFEPGIYMITFITSISFVPQGDDQYYPGAWLRLYHPTQNSFYCALHVIDRVNSKLNSQNSGTSIVKFTETTEVVARMSVQEGEASIWNAGGTVARAIRLY
jgi:hypothetical protein